MFTKKGNMFHHTNVMRGEIAPTLGEALTALPAKVIARVTRVSERAAKAWRAGEHSPRAEELIALMAEFDDVFETVCRLAGREPPPALSTEQRAALAAALHLLGTQ